MTLLYQFSRISLHNLRRGGQRVFVALLCIAFGVMSLVTMLLLSQSLRKMLVIDPPNLVGADISMVRREEEFILPADIQTLETLRQSGAIDRYTLVGYTSSLAFRLPGSGELHFPSAGIGVDSTAYPLIGSLTLSHPGNTGLRTLLEKPGDVIITNDLAMEYGLHEGDKIVLSDLNIGAAVEANIRGIVTDTPNHQGSKIYYGLTTAQYLAGGDRYLNTALVTAADAQAASDHLKKTGWQVYLANNLADNDRSVEEMFEMVLNGAGILGLLVGGIGIANTMQVLLRRRRYEVAVWKSLGYRAGQLQLLFMIEAFILGAAGSLLGAGLGVAVSRGMVNLFSKTTTLLLVWDFSPYPVLIGFMVGVVTTVIFAMFAIVITSRVQPLALLRNEQVDSTRLPWLQSCGLFILLSLPFIELTNLVMGSLWKGIAVLLAIFAGLAVLGVFLGGLAWVITRLLPLRGLPLLNMARNSLKRRGPSLLFAMIALFIGVVALAMGAVVIRNAQQAMDEKAVRIEGANISILAPVTQEKTIREAIAQQQVVKTSFGYQTSVRSIQVIGAPDERISPMLIGRSELSDFTIKGAAWGSDPEGVYTYQTSMIPAGSQVDVTLWNGTTRQFKVVGSYNVNYQSSPHSALGLILPNELFLNTTQADTVQFFTQAPVGTVQQVSARLGAALPQTTVINLIEYATRFTRTYQNLFVFAVAMASLALLAGMLLVANSVSLAMLDRRYEMGVLKAIGYTRRHVLVTLMVEYSLVALIATSAGLAAVEVFLWGVSVANHVAGSLLVMPFSFALVIGLFSVGLTLVTVLGITWKPTQVSPIIVLNDRG